MIARSRGFTVLEILLVIMLLGLVARMVVGVIPERKTPGPLLRLHEGTAWAWQQAQLERRVWKMEITSRSWQLFALTGQRSSLPGPLPDTFWLPVAGPLAQDTVSEGEFHPGNDTAWPAILLFLPDGDFSPQTVIYRDADGNENVLSLSAANLIDTTP